MAEPTRIRAQTVGDRTTVRILMAHEMESGQRKDASGKVVAAWFIQELSIAHNGKTVLTAELGQSISKNPYLQFVLNGARSGDKLGVSWVDNRGNRRSDEATVA